MVLRLIIIRIESGPSKKATLLKLMLHYWFSCLSGAKQNQLFLTHLTLSSVVFLSSCQISGTDIYNEHPNPAVRVKQLLPLSSSRWSVW